LVFTLLQSPLFQTWLAHKVTTILSDKLQIDVEIRSISIGFFNKLILDGVYIQDIDSDTLLYVNRLSASVNKLPLWDNTFAVGALKLSDGQFNLKSDTTGTNITLIIKRLSNKNKTAADTVQKVGSFKLQVKGFELENFAFTFWKYDDNKRLQNPNSIDYRDMAVDSIYLKADKISIYNDTLFYNVKSFALKEKSGYRIHNLMANCYIVPGKDVHFDNLELIDDYSNLRLKHFSMIYNGGKEFSDFIEKVVLIGDFENAEISFQSISFFAASLQNIPIKATVNGLVIGPVANLKSNNLKIEGFNNTLIDGRFSITGLPEIDETIIFADFKQLQTHPKDMFDAISRITGNRKTSLDNFLSAVKQINFKGSFTGLYNDFVANGTLTSNLGALSLDVLFKTENRNHAISFNGRVSASDFETGQLLKTDLIAKTSFDLMTKGYVPQNGTPDIFSEGTITKLIFNNYNYENIKLLGTVKENEFSGSVNINIPDIDLAFLGKINYKGTENDPVPVFDFEADLKHIDLAKLNFNKRDSISVFNGKIAANFKGSNITNYVGEIKLSDASYTDIIETIDIGKVSLISRKIGEKNSLQLQSDFVEAEYIGQYLFGEFVKELQHIAHIYVPALENFSSDTINIKQYHQNQQYVLHVKTKKSGQIARIVKPGLYIAENSTLDLLVDTDHTIKLQIDSDNIKLNNNTFDDVIINAQNYIDTLFVKILSSNVLSGGFAFQNIEIDNSVHSNLISTNLKYNNESERENTGNILLRTIIIPPNIVTSKKIGLQINVQNSSIILNDSLWWLSPSLIAIDSSRIAINKLNLYNDNQHFIVDGAISRNPNDTITIRLQNYNLENINYVSSSAGYAVTGKVSGTAEITDIYNTPLIMVNVDANDITINSDTLGNIKVASSWDNSYERLNIITRIYNDKEINALINGFMSPKDNTIQFDIQLIKMKFGYIEPLLTGIISNIQGNATGKLSLHGNFKDPKLTGKIELNQTSLLVDYLQTIYKMDAIIDVEKSKINIQNGTLYDLNNNTGRLNVTLNHNQFRDINFEAFATISNMMCLNTKKVDNPLFYGTAYATGGIRVNGTPEDIHFNITAQVERNSKLFIPLSSTVHAKEISMLTFKSTDSILIADNAGISKNRIASPKTHIDFSLDLTVTPESEIQILIDEKAGDILHAQGQGNLKINVDPSIDLFSIVGDYQVSKGDYNFTLPNVNFISRKFTIDEGSQINFNGDVTGATLNVKASYKARSVSLAPIIPSETTRGSKRYTADCQILIAGNMASPNLKFNVEFPNLDPETKAQAMSAMNTEEKMTTQFLALLVIQSFVPDQQYGGTNYGTTTILSNATNLLSGQIGNLISMLNLPIPLDVAVDIGMDDNQQISDYEVSLNTMLFDRVILNGSFGNNTNTHTDRQMIGDFEMDILLGKQGKFRLKVFTRSNDYFTDDLENNMQGIGFSYQTEFDNFRDLFGGKKKAKKRNRFLDTALNKKKDENNSPKNNNID
jgi:hypothetical protein